MKTSTASLPFIPRRWSRFAPLLVALLSLLALGLALAGYFLAAPDRPLLALYNTGRVFAFDVNPADPLDEGPPPDRPPSDAAAPKPGTNLIRAGMAIATLVALLAAAGVLAVFHDHLRLAWLHLPWGDGKHTVVVGLGHSGTNLAVRLREEGRRVVAVEKTSEDENCGVAMAREKGSIIVTGDVRDPEFLDSVQAGRAREVFFVTGSDTLNLELAYRLMKSSRRPARCFLRQNDPDAIDLLLDSPAVRAIGCGPVLRPFNPARLAARQLLQECIVDPAEPLGPHETLHVAILGFDLLGQTIAHELALQAHFPNDRRIRLTIAAAGGAGVDEFLDRYPAFCAASPESGSMPEAPWLAQAPARIDRWSTREPAWRPTPAGRVGGSDARKAIEYVVNAEFLDLPRQVDEHAFVETLHASLSAPGVRPHIVVCADQDETVNFEIARLLQRNLGAKLRRPTIHVFVPRSPDIAELISLPRRHGVRTTCFGQLDKLCSPELLRHPPGEEIAQRVHERFLRQRKASAGPGRPFDSANDPSLREWAHLEEQFRHSSRQRAFGVDVRLRMLGLQRVPDADPLPPDSQVVTEFSPGEIEMIARAEHNRWMAERLLGGWRWGEGSPKAELKRRLLHPDLIPTRSCRKKPKTTTATSPVRCSPLRRKTRNVWCGRRGRPAIPGRHGNDTPHEARGAAGAGFACGP